MVLQEPKKGMKKEITKDIAGAQLLHRYIGSSSITKEKKITMK